MRHYGSPGRLKVNNDRYFYQMGWIIDFVGPFADGGYILTMIDIFTRWVELYVWESADAQEANRCIFEDFGRFGAPSQIVSDRGSYFVNHVIMEFLSNVGTDHCLSIAYSRQENSLVERTNKEINRHTSSLFFDKLIKDNWRNGKPIVHRIRLNSTYSERTKLVLQICYAAEPST